MLQMEKMRSCQAKLGQKHGAAIKSPSVFRPSAVPDSAPLPLNQTYMLHILSHLSCDEDASCKPKTFVSGFQLVDWQKVKLT